MGKRKKMPRRPHCKVAPKEIKPAKSTGGAPEFDVRIRISKRPRVGHYVGDIQASHTGALVEALAVLIQKAAGIIGVSTDRLYAVVATVLFKETEEEDVQEITTPVRGLVHDDMEE